VEVSELKDLSKNIRIDILKMTSNANSGHPGGSLSSADIVSVLFGSVMNYEPGDPKWADRDRFILSKAHACPVLYAVLAETGFFPKSELMTFRKLNSRLQGHAHIKTPGVEMSGGSLGQGLSFGIGVSLEAKIVWEAIMSAKKFELGNLVAIVDKNGIQNDRFTHEAMDMSPLPDKWESFGWDCYEVDGHNITELQKTFNSLDYHNQIPKVIIADTTKGKGVSFMENNPDFHGKAANPEQLKQAIEEIIQSN